MFKPINITQARLKELLHYDPETGIFTWRVTRPGRFARPGSIAGTIKHGRYVHIVVERSGYLAHRLAFVYMTGKPPDGYVDHINCDKSDNRWTNLRMVTKQENAMNTGIARNNTSGYRGVCWSKISNKWVARGKLMGKDIHLGLFSSLEEAAEVAGKWRAENFGEYFFKN